jgi:TetR/AcrR family transcriptional regulator, tetracycline repressor protein
LPRPKVPLISKRKTLEAALRIIDEEGLEALSVRRLAIELNVNAASLYHHFSNKEEILVGAATLALQEVRTPETRDEDWPVWLMRNGHRLRRALVAHPGLIPIMMRRDLLGIGVAELDATAALLEEEGVPVGAIAPILDYGELLAIVCALAETEHRSGGKVAPSERFPHLRKVYLKRATSVDQVFTEAYAAGVEAIVNDVRSAAGAPMPARKAAASARGTKKAPAGTVRKRA